MKIYDRPFGQRAAEMIAQRGPLCVGIDPRPQLLQQWGLPLNGAGLWDFSMQVLDALGDRCGFFKPQSALYEEYGASGISALTATIRAIQDCGAISILDVKRGDIGSTMSAYARAYLGDAPMSTDAITVSPYLGFESLRPALDLARENHRGIFVLALTSNPEAAGLQSATIHDQERATSVGADIIRRVGQENASAQARGHLGDVGMVVGATVGERISGLENLLFNSNAPILVPGFGAQGGTSADLKRLFGTSLDRIIVNTSRGILSQGPGSENIIRAFGENLESVKTAISPAASD